MNTCKCGKGSSEHENRFCILFVSLEALTVEPIHCDFVCHVIISERIWMNCSRARTKPPLYPVDSIQGVACIFQPEELFVKHCRTCHSTQTLISLTVGWELTTPFQQIAYLMIRYDSFSFIFHPLSPCHPRQALGRGTCHLCGHATRKTGSQCHLVRCCYECLWKSSKMGRGRSFMKLKTKVLCFNR